MESTGLTFLNTTGAPRLSKSAAKRVRGHVTRANFVNRRKRQVRTETDKAEAKTTHARHTKEHLEVSAPRHGAWHNLAEALSVATTRTDQFHSAQLLNEFWSVIFLNSRGVPGGADDLKWLELLASEPALVEATMAMAVRCWSSDRSCRLRAEFHSYRATRLVIQRIGSQDAYTDGFLGAAFTLALNECLFRNDEAWQIHMNGIVQTVRCRRSHGICDLPPMFADLIILDSVNDIFDFPRVYHPALVKELGNHGGGIISTFAAMAEKVAQLRRTIHLHGKHALDPGSVALYIQAPWIQLSCDIQTFKDNKNAYVRTTAKAIQLVLALSWPPQINDSAYALLANDLKDGLAGLPGRSCLYMDLSSCQIIVGAVAAERGSEARAWFVDKLRRAVRAMEERGWDKPFEILERVVANDEYLLGRLRILWDEIEGEALTSPSR